MSPLPTDTEPHLETSQEGNGATKSATVVEGENMGKMDRKEVDNPCVIAQAKKTPEVEPLPLKIDVPPPLPLPLPPPFPSYVTPSLTPPLPITPPLLIASDPLSSPMYLEAEGEDGIVVECHEHKWKKYLEGEKLKSIPFL